MTQIQILKQDNGSYFIQCVALSVPSVNRFKQKLVKDTFSDPVSNYHHKLVLLGHYFIAILVLSQNDQT